MKITKIQRYCNKCATGTLRYNGHQLIDGQLKYKHICNKCDNFAYLLRKYPYIEKTEE